jgi:hypothetical protein
MRPERHSELPPGVSPAHIVDLPHVGHDELRPEGRGRIIRINRMRRPLALTGPRDSAAGSDLFQDGDWMECHRAGAIRTRIQLAQEQAICSDARRRAWRVDGRVIGPSIAYRSSPAVQRAIRASRERFRDIGETDVSVRHDEYPQTFRSRPEAMTFVREGSRQSCRRGPLRRTRNGASATNVSASPPSRKPNPIRSAPRASSHLSRPVCRRSPCAGAERDPHERERDPPGSSSGMWNRAALLEPVDRCPRVETRARGSA